MQNKHRTIQQISKLRAKHELALWKIEQLWGQMGERDYPVRAQLTRAAAELAQVERDIDKLAKACL